MHHKTLAELSQALKNKEYSSRELTQYFLDRIKQHDTQLNSFITVTEELALKQADLADQRLAKGDAEALTGIPLAQKDIFCTQGVKTSCGSKMLDNFIAPYDATLIRRCNEAGMVMLGKTNMDELAMGSSNETSFYGPVANPWDLERTPGGSSGGSAAAVAAYLTPAATGTDTGGSIRQPAALCGITGLKPTYGRISRYGMTAFASSLDQAGPMARSAEDVALLMNVFAGHDPLDSTSVQKEVPDYTADLKSPLKDLKIGLPKEYFGEGLNPAIAEALEKAKAVFAQQGVQFVDLSLPHTDLALSVYYILAPAECSSNLSRFDGVRYGYRCKDPKDLEDMYCRSRSEAFGEEVKRRILIGTYVLSQGFYDAYYLKAQQVRRLIRDDFTKAFQSVDLILAPTTPTTAFKLKEITDPVSMYLSDIYTLALNLAGLPGLSLPVGFSEGLPIGMQLIGNYFSEATLLKTAHQYQCASDWHLQFPKNF